MDEFFMNYLIKIVIGYEYSFRTLANWNCCIQLWAMNIAFFTKFLIE